MKFGKMVAGGDVVSGNGMGAISKYGKRFADENFTIRHGGEGFLSMANSGRFSLFLMSSLFSKSTIVFSQAQIRTAASSSSLWPPPNGWTASTSSSAK